MNTKQVEKLIMKYMKYWKIKMGLFHWNIDVDYIDGKSIEDGWIDTATCDADWPHQKALVSFYPEALADGTESNIERTVIHELLHIVVNEMRDKGIKHEERVVSGLTNAFVWTKEGVK